MLSTLLSRVTPSRERRGRRLSAALLGSLLSASGAHAQVGVEEAERWQADLGELVVQLSERHVDLHHTISEDSFIQAVESLYLRIPDLEQHEILVELSQLVARIGDGHTSLNAADQRGKAFRYFPLRFWVFDDGIRVIATSDQETHLLGGLLVRIDDTPIDIVRERLTRTISADNPMEIEYSLPFLLNRPELLAALDITESLEGATFTFAGGQATKVKAIDAATFDAGPWVTANPLFEGRQPPRMMLNFLFATPLMGKSLAQGKYYWFTYIEDSRTIFLQYNTCWDQGSDNPFATMVEEFFRTLDEMPVERVVLDLRQNSGGEPRTAEPLIDGLAARVRLGKEGRLFVITGRRTFSAAVTNAADLRRKAGARLVGEAPRGKPNHPSEGRDIVLEGTGVVATVSTQFVERDPELGDAPLLPIDIPVPMTWAAFAAAEDAALAAALSAELLVEAK